MHFHADIAMTIPSCLVWYYEQSVKNCIVYPLVSLFLSLSKLLYFLFRERERERENEGARGRARGRGGA